jgi:hypothetical protein
MIQDILMAAAPQDILREVAGDGFGGAVPEDDPPLPIHNVNTVKDAVQDRGQDAVIFVQLLQYGIAFHLAPVRVILVRIFRLPGSGRRRGTAGGQSQQCPGKQQIEIRFHDVFFGRSSGPAEAGGGFCFPSVS